MVWVGFDDNQPLGLSGAQAALPIWTAFMKRALAGRANVAVRGAGRRQLRRDRSRHRQDGTPICPRVTSEAFLAGTEPLESATCTAGELRPARCQSTLRRTPASGYNSQ